MAEGVGVQVGKIRVFLLQPVPHTVQILCNVVRIHRSTVLIGKQVATFLPEVPVPFGLFAAPLQVAAQDFVHLRGNRQLTRLALFGVGLLVHTVLWVVHDAGTDGDGLAPQVYGTQLDARALPAPDAVEHQHVDQRVPLDALVLQSLTDQC